MADHRWLARHQHDDDDQAFVESMLLPRRIRNIFDDEQHHCAAIIHGLTAPAIAVAVAVAAFAQEP